MVWFIKTSGNLEMHNLTISNQTGDSWWIHWYPCKMNSMLIILANIPYNMSTTTSVITFFNVWKKDCRNKSMHQRHIQSMGGANMVRHVVANCMFFACNEHGWKSCWQTLMVETVHQASAFQRETIRSLFFLVQLICVYSHHVIVTWGGLVFFW